MIFFSIIIPVYNQEKNIEELIKSLLNQNYPKSLFEIIAVDNASTDKSKAIIKKFEVKYVFEKKPSSYAARNAGAKNAKGDVFAFIDGDMKADKNWLLNANKIIGKYDIVGGKIINMDSAKRYLTLFDSIIINPNRELNLRKNHRICGGNFFIFSSVFNNLGGFDSNLISGGDALISIDAIKNNYKIGYASDAIAYHPVDGVVKRIKRNMRLAFGCIEKDKKEKKRKKSKINNLFKNTHEDFFLLKKSLKEKTISKFDFLVLSLIVLIFKFFTYLVIFLAKLLLKSNYVSRL